MIKINTVFKNILIIIFISVILFSCKNVSKDLAVEVVVKAYNKYVKDCGEKKDLRNVPQYIMILPQGQDELAIELVPYFKKVLASQKISRKRFAMSISRALTEHKFAKRLDKEIKKINPYFEGDMYGIIKKSLEYLRRGVPTLRDNKTGEISLFNYKNFINALRKMRSSWRNQNFATLYFFHNEKDRYKFEENLKKLRKNIPNLVAVANIVNLSGLELYKMDYLRFYEIMLNHIHNQINYTPHPAIKKLVKQYFFFLNKEIASGKYQMIYPDFQKILTKKIKFSVQGDKITVKFKNGSKLTFTKEGKYWRLPKLPQNFWKLPLFTINKK